jgi:hypothetical protein
MNGFKIYKVFFKYSNTCDEAAKNNRLNVLQWVRSNVLVKPKVAFFKYNSVSLKRVGRRKHYAIS